MEDFKKDDWVMVFSSPDSTDVNILKLKLADSGIDAVIFNHQDSMLTSLNDVNYSVTLYVHENEAAKAKQIIENR